MTKNQASVPSLEKVISDVKKLKEISHLMAQFVGIHHGINDNKGKQIYSEYSHFIDAAQRAIIANLVTMSTAIFAYTKDDDATLENVKKLLENQLVREEFITWRARNHYEGQGVDSNLIDGKKNCLTELCMQFNKIYNDSGPHTDLYKRVKIFRNKILSHITHSNPAKISYGDVWTLSTNALRAIDIATIIFLDSNLDYETIKDYSYECAEETVCELASKTD